MYLNLKSCTLYLHDNIKNNVLWSYIRPGFYRIFFLAKGARQENLAWNSERGFNPTQAGLIWRVRLHTI
jgi:hypothetical protein